MVASAIPWIPKHPPSSEEEKKFDHIQFLNLIFVVVAGKTMRSLKVSFEYETDFVEIVIDGDKKWSKFEFWISILAEFSWFLINSEVK